MARRKRNYGSDLDSKVLGFFNPQKFHADTHGGSFLKPSLVVYGAIAFVIVYFSFYIIGWIKGILDSVTKGNIPAWAIIVAGLLIVMYLRNKKRGY